MSKKNDQYYFDNFIACTNSACQAARMLEENLNDFHVDTLQAKLDALHEIEHGADQKKHEMMGVLVKAFITPIEREDIILLSQGIDEVTDKIEDVALRMYCNNIEDIFPPAKAMVKVVIESCEEMVKMLEEFKNFKKSKTLHESIIRINTLEEDRLFIDGMRELHTKENDPIKIITWRELLIYLEKCTDATEHVADVCERVIMTNT